MKGELPEEAFAWPIFFRRFLRLPEEKRVRIAELVGMEPQQAIEHPKYFAAQVYAILCFARKYWRTLPVELRQILVEVATTVLRGE